MEDIRLVAVMKMNYALCRSCGLKHTEGAISMKKSKHDFTFMRRGKEQRSVDCKKRKKGALCSHLRNYRAIYLIAHAFGKLVTLSNNFSCRADWCPRIKGEKQ